MALPTKIAKDLAFLPFPKAKKYRDGEFLEYLAEQVESDGLVDNIILEDGIICKKSDKKEYKELIDGMKAEYKASLDDFCLN